MADPRNTVSSVGLRIETETFAIDNSTIVYDGTKVGGADATMLGKAVAMSAADTVKLVADGDLVIGKLLAVESDNKALVQVEGTCTLPQGNGATTTFGKKFVGALGAASAKGYIRDATTGDELKAVGVIRNGATATAVIVDLC